MGPGTIDVRKLWDVHVLASICSNVKIAVRFPIRGGSRFISAMAVRLPTRVAVNS
jgi:hypothetical protein